MSTDPVAGQRVVVIGAGIAGLATAALLAEAGADVVVAEARDEIGGRVGVWERDGFTFDLGPSWYLMPEVFEHFFQMLGTTTSAELDLIDLDPGYRVYFEGERLPVDVPRHGAVDVLVALGDGSPKLREYLESASFTYRLAVDRFLYSTFQSFRAFLTPAVLTRIPTLIRLLVEPLDRMAARFTNDHRIRQILGYPAVFLGADPRRVPSMYHLMSHLDIVDGVRYPRGGFGELIRVCARLATERGATIRTGAHVTRITTAGTVGAGTTATGVELAGGETIAADVVVSTADLHVTEHELLPRRLRSHSDAWWRRRDPGPGAVLAMLGVRGEVPELLHHTLMFTRDWELGFDAIFGASPGDMPDPASIYVCRPSASDAVAPAGHEALFVLVPVPADVSIGAGGLDGAGDPGVEHIVQRAIRQIADWADVSDLAERIVVRRTLGPADFAREFGACQGGALGPGHTLRQSAFFRGANRSSHVRNLLYAGATTIPGVGLPMCIISAELVLKRLRGDLSAGPTAVPA